MTVQDYDGWVGWGGGAVFEVKYSRRLEDLPGDCENAIEQIGVQRCADEFSDECSTVIF